MTDSFTKQNRLAIAFLLALCLGVFFNTFSNAFVWDDLSLIPGDRYIKTLRHIPLFFTPRYWSDLQPYSDLAVVYRPVRTITFAIDYFFWGLNPAGYHFTNLLLHAANVLLIFYLITVIGRSAGDALPQNNARGPWLMGLPFLTAALFAVHPVHTESVTYVKNRSDLLALLFFLAAWLLFIRTGAPVRRLTRLAGSLLCFVLAVLSKEVALTLPGVLAFHAFCFQDKKERFHSYRWIVPYGLMILVYGGFILALRARAGIPADDFHISVGRHVLAVVKTVGTYLSLLAFPFHLNADRAFFIPHSIREPAVLLSLAVMAAIAVAAVLARRRSRTIFFGIGFMLLTLIPPANIIFLESRPIAEQRLYIPSLGFCLILAWLINRLYRFGLNKKAWIVLPWLIGGLVMVGFSARAIVRNRDWKDPLTFYTRTLAVSPDSSKIHNSLGAFLSDRGQPEQAMAHYEAALRLNPDYAQAYNNLGVELSETGRPDEAVRQFEEALRLDPGYASAYYNLAAVLLEKGDVAAAIAHYETAVRLKPDAEMLNNLGSAYAIAGRLEEAMDRYLAALRLDPDFTLALDNLGNVLNKIGDIEKAADHVLAPVLSTRQMAGVYHRLATIRLENGDQASAALYFRRAAALDPNALPRHQ
ncbi:MAG: tetratricopeptide repeat protein [Thermodesulfobacteriota bacterium]